MENENPEGPEIDAFRKAVARRIVNDSDERICKECVQPIHPNKIKSAIFCSIPCKNKHKNKKRRIINYERVCKQCTDPISPTKIKGTLFCSTLCGITYKNRSRYSEKETKFCLVCQKLVPSSKRRDALYCSVECRAKESSKRNNSKNVERYRKKVNRPTPNICSLITCNIPLRFDNSTGFCANHYVHSENSRVSGANHARKRRSLLANCFIEVVDPVELWKRDAGLCVLCGFPADKNDWWMEHLIPITRGGEHSYENAFVSHPRCNNEKNNKLLGEYIKWQMKTTLNLNKLNHSAGV